MDNLSHTLAGLALARAGLGRTTRLATTALVVASNLPDADILSGGRAELVYFEAHRGITHSLVGAVVLGAVLGAVLWALDRLRPRRRGPVPGPAKVVPLMAVSVLGALVHLGFDSLNNYGVRPLLPFAETRFYGDLVFIADPWFWLVLGGGVHLSTRRSLAGEVACWGGWTLLTLFVFSTGEVPPTAKAVWGAGLLGLAALRFGPDLAGSAFRIYADDPRATATPARGATNAGPARVSLAALALYLLGVYALHGAALRRAEVEARAEEHGGALTNLAALPRPADPSNWSVLYETPADIVAGSVAVWGGGASALHPRRYAKNLDLPEVGAALNAPEGQIARRFCRYLFAEIRETSEGRAVAFRDARFAIGGHDGWATFVVPIEERGPE